jgi:hypothetical protein
MKRKLWIAAAVIALVLGAAGYTIAQSTGTTMQGGPGWMMGSGMMGDGMMGGGMMGQGGQGGTVGSGMMGMMTMMTGQPLTQEQLEQFAKQHGITAEQAKQMTDTCTQIMARTNTPETPKQ